MGEDIGDLDRRLGDWLNEHALPLWWEVGADHRRGGFIDTLDSQGRPMESERRARVQARQTYVYATAGALGWNGPWREAVAHGLDYFLEHYRRPDGLFRTRVTADGAVADDTAWLYDQAFALLGMASGAAALPERRESLTAAARELFASLQSWRLPEGGFIEPPAGIDRQSNPHMHLLEAALAWRTLDPDGPWSALCGEIADLTLDRFIDGSGQLHEFFVKGWRPHPDIDGRIVEPGHQFEWSWLLWRWGEAGGGKTHTEAARTLYDCGRRGVESERGVALQQLLDDGTVHDPVARLWPQTEWIKAACVFGDAAEVARAVRGLELYLARTPQGSWWDKLKPDGTFVDEPAPASSFYHIVCALAELRRYVSGGGSAG